MKPNQLANYTPLQAQHITGDPKIRYIVLPKIYAANPGATMQLAKVLR
jgi:hypothetical protein